MNYSNNNDYFETNKDLELKLLRLDNARNLIKAKRNHDPNCENKVNNKPLEEKQLKPECFKVLKMENFNFSCHNEGKESFDLLNKGYNIKQIESNNTNLILEYTFPGGLLSNNTQILAQFTLNIKKNESICNQDRDFVDYIPKIINCNLSNEEEIFKEEIEIHRDDIPKLIVIFLQKVYFKFK